MKNIELALDASIIPDIISLVSSGIDSLISPSLRVLGNFATGNDTLTQIVIDTNVLKNVIPSLFKLKNPSITKESCWLISNILAGTREQIQSVIDSGLLPLLVSILEKGDHRSQCEAGWAFANLAHGGSVNQILEICRVKGCVESLCSSLKVKNNEFVCNLLETLFSVMSTVFESAPENFERLKDVVEECGGLDIIEELQQAESEKIYTLAYKIVEDFFGEEQESDNVPLDLTENVQFMF